MNIPLNADVIGLLVHYIPLFMHEVCKQVPIIATNRQFIKLLSDTGKPIDRIMNKHHIIDAIRRNEIEYCRRSFADHRAKSAIIAAMPDVKYQSREGELGELNYHLDMYWYSAVAYGRSEILDILQKIDRRCDLILSDTIKNFTHEFQVDIVMNNIHPLLIRSVAKNTVNYDRFMQRLIPNKDIMQWIIRNCIEPIDNHTSYFILNQLIKSSNVELIEWFYYMQPIGLTPDTPAVLPDKMSDKMFQAIKSSGRTISNSVIIESIIENPEVLRWAKTKEWRRPDEPEDQMSEIKAMLMRDQ
jgi:hypothetical protein